MTKVADLCPDTLRWVAAKVKRDANRVEKMRTEEGDNLTTAERDIAWGEAEALFHTQWSLLKLASRAEKGSKMKVKEMVEVDR